MDRLLEDEIMYYNTSTSYTTHVQQENPEEAIVRVLQPKIILMSVIAVVVTLANGLLLATILRHKYLRQKDNYFVVALSAADFLLGSVSVPLHILGEAGIAARSDWTCLVMMALSSAQIVLSVLMLFALSLERYLKLVHPFLYAKYVTENRVLGIIAACVGYSLFFGFLPLTGWNNIDAAASEDGVYTCRFQIVLSGSYMGVLFVGHITPHFLLLPIMHLRVFLTAHRVLKRSSLQSMRNGLYRPQKKTSSGSMQVVNGVNPVCMPLIYRQRSYRHFKILVVMGVYFIISWMPLTIWEAVLWHGFTKPAITVEDLLNPPIRMKVYYVALGLAILNSAINPIIFGAGNKTIRRTLMRHFKSRSWRVSNEDISKSYGSIFEQKFHALIPIFGIHARYHKDSPRSPPRVVTSPTLPTFQATHPILKLTRSHSLKSLLDHKTSPMVTPERSESRSCSLSTVQTRLALDQELTTCL